MATITYTLPTNISELDVASTNAELVISCLQYETFSAHYLGIDGVLTTGIITLEWSNNQADWFAFSPAVTLTAGITNTPVLDVSGYAVIRFRVSTAESSKRVRLGVCMKGGA